MFSVTAIELFETYLNNRPVFRIDDRTEYEKLVAEVNGGLELAVEMMRRREYVRVVRVMQEPHQPRPMFERHFADLLAAGFSVIYYKAITIPDNISGKGLHGDFIEIQQHRRTKNQTPRRRLIRRRAINCKRTTQFISRDFLETLRGFRSG
ncbi:hypothetical protein [Paraburkholderia sp. SIMBA_054]|uniref:hypothetical protein n=1 Tax=Paraburkholderia sp. SIMBA_054 TaxID=3085795 RepID=UPI0039791BFB